MARSRLRLAFAPLFQSSEPQNYRPDNEGIIRMVQMDRIHPIHKKIITKSSSFVASFSIFVSPPFCKISKECIFVNVRDKIKKIPQNTLGIFL